MKRLLLPKQHGAWVMLGLPYLIGMIAGGPKWIHIPLFLGWLFLYLASYPIMMYLKKKRSREQYLKWIGIYMSLAILFVSLPLFLYVKLLLLSLFLLPLLIVNMFYARQNNERAFLNDISAIAGLCLGGPASYFVGTQQWDEKAVLIWISSVLFFMGSVFFVKTMIREKKNPKFKLYSWGYHSALPVGIAGAGFLPLSLAYLPSMARAIIFYGKPLKPKHIAVVEFTNSAYFLIFMTVLIRFI
ncbi:YwiC-like family protein [Pseudalkalibacillus caeni]|uniref:YwiC-like family protein n=1 Tax=Exobacillus caeni TaxID=2574798 RepID=A0A5R9F5R6_9BACL|nr:YwiC-like family protein [Pseudalkalibacillus caeni]TLS37829.1 hypothetical protein FCL54_08400 [Pseudalkalibacillus caeni]